MRTSQLKIIILCALLKRSLILYVMMNAKRKSKYFFGKVPPLHLLFHFILQSDAGIGFSLTHVVHFECNATGSAYSGVKLLF